MSHQIASPSNQTVEKIDKERVKNCCRECAFFDKFPIQKKDDNLLGACKYGPPTPAPDYSDSKLGVWPLVLGTFWCGAFSYKDTKET